MSSQFDIYSGAMARRALGVRGDIIGNQYGQLLVAQGMPDNVELALAGKMFTANTLTGTAIAPAVAPLTTNAQHVLYNSNANKRYLILLAAWITVESGTRAIGSSLYGGVTLATEATAPTAYTNSANGAVGGHNGTAEGVYDASVTLDTAPVWFVIAAEDKLADASESSSIYVDLSKRGIIVPPTLSFAMSIRDSDTGTTPLYSAGFVWAEVDFDV